MNTAGMVMSNSSQLFNWAVKFLTMAMAVFYIGFSVLLLQKTRYMCNTLINDMGKILITFAMVNLLLAVILSFTFLFS